MESQCLNGIFQINRTNDERYKGSIISLLCGDHYCPKECIFKRKITDRQIELQIPIRSPLDFVRCGIKYNEVEIVIVSIIV